MKRSLAPLAFTAALLVSACQTVVSPVEVTRFHVNPPPVAGTLSVTPADGDDSMEYRTYADAVAGALGRHGFRTGGAARAEYRAIVGYRVAVDRPYARRSPVSVGMGGATGSYGSGLGVGIGIDLSGRPKDVVSTELSVRIVRQADGTTLWEGRAATQAREDAPVAQPGAAAVRLADALFRDFPGRSGETIIVK